MQSRESKKFTWSLTPQSKNKIQILIFDQEKQMVANYYVTQKSEASDSVKLWRQKKINECFEELKKVTAIVENRNTQFNLIPSYTINGLPVYSLQSLKECQEYLSHDPIYDVMERIGLLYTLDFQKPTLPGCH